MKKKFKIKTIEDIALQFLKHNKSQKGDIDGSNDTIVESKYYVKKYIKNKNSDSQLSQNFEKLIPCENSKDEANNKVKIIAFYKVPPKVIGDEEECMFENLNGTEKTSFNNSKIIKQKMVK